MPFSGGLYTFPSLPGSFNPAVEGQDATAAAWNTLAADLTANGLSMCITRNGTSTISANIPMAGFVLTGLGAGAANGQSLRYEQATLYGYLGGLGTSNNAGTPNTKLDVAAGAAADNTNVNVIRCTAGTIDCGTVGANGLDAGALGNTTWYHVFAIGKTDGTSAFLGSLSPSAPTLPTGYTLKRRIGSFKTDGSAHILPFLQNGDKFQWTTLIAETPGSGAGPTTQALLGVPTGVVVTAILTCAVTATSGGQVFLRVTTPTMSNVTAVLAAPTSLAGVAIAFVDTDTSAQVNFTYTNVSNVSAATASTVGWIDRRGKDA